MRISQTKLSLLLLCILSLGTLSCSRVAEGIEFDFTIDGQFPVPKGIPAATPFDLPTLPVGIDVKRNFERNGTNSDLIKEIKMKALDLVVKEPAGGSFDFLKEIEIRFFKEGIGEKLVAWKYNIPSNPGSQLILDTTPNALDDYLKSGDFEMRLRVKLSKVTTKDYTVGYNILASVKADLFK